MKKKLSPLSLPFSTSQLICTQIALFEKHALCDVMKGNELIRAV